MHTPFRSGLIFLGSMNLMYCQIKLIMYGSAIRLESPWGLAYNKNPNIWLIVVIVGIVHLLVVLPVFVALGTHHITHIAEPSFTPDTSNVHTSLFVEWQTDSLLEISLRHRRRVSLSSLTIHLIRFVFEFSSSLKASYVFRLHNYHWTVSRRWLNDYWENC